VPSSASAWSSKRTQIVIAHGGPLTATSRSSPWIREATKMRRKRSIAGLPAHGPEKRWSPCGKCSTASSAYASSSAVGSPALSRATSPVNFLRSTTGSAARAPRPAATPIPTPVSIPRIALTPSFLGRTL